MGGGGVEERYREGKGLGRGLGRGGLAERFREREGLRRGLGRGRAWGEV